MTPEQLHLVVSAGLEALRAKARALGFDVSDDAIALVANVIRPILGFARRYTVSTATATDHRSKKKD